MVSKYRTLLRVHGLNYHFSKEGNVIKGFAQLGIAGMMREWYWKNQAWKEKVLKQVEFFSPTLVSPTYHERLQSNPKWVDVVPLSFSSGSSPISSGTFTVAIPGAVETTRRDYNTVLRVMEQLRGEDIRWIFLGNMVTEEIRLAIDHLQQAGVEVYYYTEVVPDEKFDEVMKISNVILAPVNAYHPFKTVTEVPGVTKISGATSDALYYQKPILLPAHYPAQEVWKPLAQFYTSSDHLAEQIISLSNTLSQQVAATFPIDEATKQLESIFARCIKG